MRSVVEIGTSVPAFLGKLWKLVNDSETNHLITWGANGQTFTIKNQADFARELLPLYYKHNNMASFIRQLNMYGFHKITSVENGGLRFENDEIEFTHPCFIKGHAYLLEHIKRKIANPKSNVSTDNTGEKVLLKPEIMSKVLADVKQMKGKQESMDAKFSLMKQENEALWREVAVLRQKHIKQQQIVNNLIQFLMSLVQPTRPGNATNNGVGVKRPYQLMINNAAHSGAYEQCKRLKNLKTEKDAESQYEFNEDNLEDGPTIYELAHDDMLHNETSQDVIDPGEYITIDVPISPFKTNEDNIATTPTQYQVTMEEGDDLQFAEQNPINSPVDLMRLTEITPIVNSPSPSYLPSTSPAGTSPSPTLTPKTTDSVANDTFKNHVTILPGVYKVNPILPNRKTTRNVSNNSKSKVPSPSGFNTITPATDFQLPANIFAGDDPVTDATLTEQIAIPTINIPLNIPSDTNELQASTSKDKLLNQNENFNVNVKLENPEKKKKSKGSSKSTQANKNNLNMANIKTEMQEETDWNNMSVATVNQNNELNRLSSMNRRDYFSKNHEDKSSPFGPNKNKSDMDDHLDTMQSDLESLRELLRCDSYSLDTNTLMGLFGQDDPFYGLSFNNMPDDRAKGNESGDAANQLISYTGNIPDLDFTMSELEAENSQDCASLPVLEDDTILNTPLIKSPTPPDFRP